MENDALWQACADDAPLYRAVRDYAGGKPLRLHTPGHAGRGGPMSPLLGGALTLDVTELPPTDSLFEASGAILQAEEKAAEAFGATRTLFSAGGATLCIQAMLRLVSMNGGRRILCARGAHRSAVSAMALLGLSPVWLWPAPAPGSALPGVVTPQAVETALAHESGIAAVYLTSPNYWGERADIAAIAAACHRRGVPLLVDGAHGAHLHYLENGAAHPLALGADMVCDSAHKTLPVLTGGAWLHVRAHAGFSRGAAKDAMALFGSSSPNYLILLSLDLTRAWGRRAGVSAFSALRARVEKARAALARMGFAAPPACAPDPVRLTLDVGRAGLTGARADELLRAQGVFAEMHDDAHLVLLPSPFLEDADFARLLRAFAALPKGGAPVAPQRPPLPHPAADMTPAQALRAPCERLPVRRLAGRVAAEGASPCPPGIPLVCPGERITPELTRSLETYGITALNVVK